MENNLRWDLTTIYKNDVEIQEDIKKVREDLEKVKELKNNPKNNLVDLLQIDTEIDRRLSKLYTYAHMKKDEDSNIDSSQKLEAEILNIANEASTELAFLQPLLLGLNDNEISELKNNKELKDYDIYLERILRYKEHTLSDKEEELLSALSSSRQTPSKAYYYLTNTDMKFEHLEDFDVQINNHNFVELQNNEDRNLRKAVFKSYYDTYNNFGNTIAQLYYSHIDNLSKIAKLRKYNSVREMYLYNDDVDVSVYDALIDSIHNNLNHIHKYYGIKKRALGLDEQHMYDVYMPITSDFDKKYTFEEAKNIVLESIKPLGEEYVNIAKKAFDDRWIDVEPREGKRSGAYSSGSYDTNPFILLNFNGTLESVFTLAHELGHSMHSYYDRNTNDYLHSGYTIFVAEVASTFNEALLLDYMMKNTEDEAEKLYLIGFYIDSYKSTVFRQTMFAEFEREVHAKIENGEVLTKTDFSEIYHQLNKKYFGDAMISDEEIAYEWMRIPHFYSNFYVYKYATGFTASSILARRVLDGKENALEDYIKFLRDGNKHFPIEQLKIAGVDMSKRETVDESLKIFANLVDELDGLIK